MIDGVNVDGCKYLNTFSDCDGYHYYCDLADDIKNEYCEHYKNCYFKQLQEEKFENLNNRQIVESAENLIYENSELIKNLEEKKQECEELKKQLMQKSEVDMFFNTPIEGWSNDPCGICPHKAENEELKKELNGSEKWRIKAESLNEKLELNNGRYLKALEEIEKVINNILNSCLGRNTAGCRPAHNVCGDLINILDIINKAKDTTNET